MASARILLPGLLAALLAACGPADSPEPASAEAPEPEAPAEQLVIRGELYYPERIALPPDSVAVVELRAVDERVLLATTAEALDDRQVPIQFELSLATAELPEEDVVKFRGGIRSHPGPLRVTESVAIEARSGEVNLGSVRLRTVPETAFGVSYRCGERGVVFGSLGAYERLVVDDEVFDLQPEIAASGARYTGVDDGETEFWSKGEEATVTLRGEVLANCTPMTEPEFPFRARGQEPGWHLHMDEEAMVLRAHYGELELSFPRVRPVHTAEGTRYAAEKDGHSLTVLVNRQACNDTMADISFPYRVRYTLDGETHSGCGGEPREVLIGGKWLIEEIGGEPVVDGTVPTIEFLVEDGEDRFAGRASCNRYMGRFQVTGEGVNLSPAASTLMACPDETQALQERRLLGLLGEVYGFGIDEQDRLVLRTSASTILARR